MAGTSGPGSARPLAGQVAVWLVDGSGLSRYDEIAPAALVRLLRRVSQLPESDVFVEALPVAGEDGTLPRRFVSTAGSGAV
ncbi:MAG: D-alanyl-D-alanine carboxypeptidase, partial [Gemmatimonadota bacterium]